MILARKLRVYELGRHYGTDSKQIMALLKKMKVSVQSHMSVVEDEDVDRVAVHDLLNETNPVVRRLATATPRGERHCRDRCNARTKLPHLSGLPRGSVTCSCT